MEKLFILCVAIMAFASLPAYADESGAPVGSSLKLDAEVASATEIVIGKFTDIQKSGAVMLGPDRYHAHIAVLNVLKGDATKNLKVVLSVGDRPKELVPNLNDEYIVILDKETIRKIIPVTGDNIAKVKILIEATPAEK